MRVILGNFYYAPHRTQWGVWQWDWVSENGASGKFIKDFRSKEEARAADPHYDFDSKVGISSETGISAQLSETTYKMGATTYDFSKPELIFGEDFEISEPSPLSDIPNIKTRSIFLGTIFEVTTKETRNGDKTNIIIGISDGASATYLRKMLPNEEIGWVKGIKAGQHVAVIGRVQRDKFDNEIQILPRGVKKISREYRRDNADEKRVELHLHTQMSAMDALIAPEAAVKQAHKWGHPAVAITDHGNVQAFPEVMLALEASGSDLKILYGILKVSIILCTYGGYYG